MEKKQDPPVQADVLDEQEIVKIWKYWSMLDDSTGYDDLLMAIFTWKLFTAHRTDDMCEIMWEDLIIDEIKQFIEATIGK